MCSGVAGFHPSVAVGMNAKKRGRPRRAAGPPEAMHTGPPEGPVAQTAPMGAMCTSPPGGTAVPPEAGAPPRKIAALFGANNANNYDCSPNGTAPAPPGPEKSLSDAKLFSALRDASPAAAAALEAALRALASSLANALAGRSHDFSVLRAKLPVVRNECLGPDGPPENDGLHKILLKIIYERLLLAAVFAARNADDPAALRAAADLLYRVITEFSPGPAGPEDAPPGHNASPNPLLTSRDRRLRGNFAALLGRVVENACLDELVVPARLFRRHVAALAPLVGRPHYPQAEIVGMLRSFQVDEITALFRRLIARPPGSAAEAAAAAAAVGVVDPTEENVLSLARLILSPLPALAGAARDRLGQLGDIVPTSVVTFVMAVATGPTGADGGYFPPPGHDGAKEHCLSLLSQWIEAVGLNAFAARLLAQTLQTCLVVRALRCWARGAPQGHDESAPGAENLSSALSQSILVALVAPSPCGAAWPLAGGPLDIINKLADEFRQGDDSGALHAKLSLLNLCLIFCAQGAQAAPMGPLRAAIADILPHLPVGFIAAALAAEAEAAARLDPTRAAPEAESSVYLMLAILLCAPPGRPVPHAQVGEITRVLSRVCDPVGADPLRVRVDFENLGAQADFPRAALKNYSVNQLLRALAALSGREKAMRKSLAALDKIIARPARGKGDKIRSASLQREENSAVLARCEALAAAVRLAAAERIVAALSAVYFFFALVLHGRVPPDEVGQVAAAFLFPIANGIKVLDCAPQAGGGAIASQGDALDPIGATDISTLLLIANVLLLRSLCLHRLISGAEGAENAREFLAYADLISGLADGLQGAPQGRDGDNAAPGDAHHPNGADGDFYKMEAVLQAAADRLRDYYENCAPLGAKKSPKANSEEVSSLLKAVAKLFSPTAPHRVRAAAVNILPTVVIAADFPSSLVRAAVELFFCPNGVEAAPSEHDASPERPGGEPPSPLAPLGQNEKRILIAVFLAAARSAPDTLFRPIERALRVPFRRRLRSGDALMLDSFCDFVTEFSLRSDEFSPEACESMHRLIAISLLQVGRLRPATRVDRLLPSIEALAKRHPSPQWGEKIKTALLMLAARQQRPALARAAVGPPDIPSAQRAGLERRFAAVCRRMQLA